MTFSIEKMFMIVMFIIIIFLVYKVNKLSTSIQENMTTSDSSLMLSTVSNEINRIYNMDTEAIRNLGAISKSLLTGTNYHSTTVGTPGTLTIPANTTNLSGDANITGDTTMIGNLTVSPTSIFNLLPRGIIVAWSNTSTPAGWTICDGTNGAPDLRGRFVLGGSLVEGLIGNDMTNPLKPKPLTPRIFKGLSTPITSGEETHTLIEEELPGHAHTLLYNFGLYSDCHSGGGGAPCGNSNVRPRNVLTDYMNPLNNTNTQYGDRSQASNANGNYPAKTHNIMPPFYVLIYIMKL